MKYLIELVADPKGIEPAITAIDELNAKEKELKTTTTQVSAEQKKMLDAYAEKAKLGKASIDKMVDGYKQLGKAATGAFGGEAIKGATKAAESFRTQLRGSREEVTKLFVEGKATTAQIYEAARAGGNLKDAIGDAQQAISVLASDTFKFDAALQGLQVGAAGFQALQAGAALFGEEGEDLQRVLVKLNATMAFTQAVQQIVNLTQKQSALSLGANIIAQRAYALVVGQSTGAMVAFRVVLATLTGGFILAGIVALVMSFGKLKEAIGGYSSSMQKSLDIKQKQLDLYDEMDAAHENEIKKLELEGASQEQLIRLSQLYVKQKIEETKKVVELAGITLQKTAESYAKGLAIANAFPGGGTLFAKIFFAGEGDIEKAIQQNKDLSAKLLKLEGESLDLDLQLKQIYDKKAEGLKAKRLKSEQDEKAWLDEMNQYYAEKNLKRIDDNEKSFIESEKRKLAAAMETNKILQEQADDILKTNAENLQKLTEQLNYENGLKQEAYLEEKKLKQERDEAIKETSIQIAQQTADAIFQIVNTNRNNEFNAQIQRLNELKDKELANKELTDSQRERIEIRYQKKIAEIKTKQAIADRNAAIAQALINGALAITKILTSVTVLNPAAYAAIAVTAATTASQIAIISAQKIPKFAKGTEFVHGGGTETSDSVPAMLSRGERVIDAKTNKLLKGIPNSMIPKLLIPDIASTINNNNSFDYNKMAKVFSKELANNPSLMVNLDKSGFSTFIKQGVTVSQIKNNRNGI